MTNKQAVGVIKFEIACVNRQDTPQCTRDCKKCDLCLPTEDVLQAYEMAIKALSQEPCRVKNELNVELNELKPCTDAVSRDAILEGLKGCICEEWIKTLFATMVKQLPSVTQKSETVTEFADRCRECGARYGKLLEQQPCDDLISREDAFEIIASNDATDGTEPIFTGRQVVALLSTLPSVTQKCEKCAMNGSGSKYCDNCGSKSGKWNKYYTSQKGNDVFNCKECGHTFVVTQGKDNMNFCPNCGCRMVEPQESEEQTE